VELVKATVDGLRRGQMVQSLAGRDQGQLYIIVGFLEDHLLLLANGRERPITRPKKKNIRHVKVLFWIDPSIEAKLNNGETVTDEEIRNSLNRRQEELEEGAMILG
jgi:large subunit ribosomal protein L14e